MAAYVVRVSPCGLAGDERDCSIDKQVFPATLLHRSSASSPVRWRRLLQNVTEHALPLWERPARLFESRGNLFARSRAKPRRDVQIGVGTLGALVASVIAEDPDTLWKFSIIVDGSEHHVRGAELREMIRGKASLDNE